MSSVIQFIGTFASVFSIPLAIIIYLKTSDARQNKTRLEIIRSLSYRIGEGKSLSGIEVSAVFNSKIREHNIRKPLFTETSILEDIIADVVSNPFLTSEQKTPIINNISGILDSYGFFSKNIDLSETTECTVDNSIIKETKPKEKVPIYSFFIITVSLSVILTLLSLYTWPDFFEQFSDTIPVDTVLSLLIAALAGVLMWVMEVLIERIKKK